MEQKNVFQKYEIEKDNEIIKNSLTISETEFGRLNFLGDKIVAFLLTQYMYKNTSLTKKEMAFFMLDYLSNASNLEFSKKLRA